MGVDLKGIRGEGLIPRCIVRGKRRGSSDSDEPRSVAYKGGRLDGSVYIQGGRGVRCPNADIAVRINRFAWVKPLLPIWQRDQGVFKLI